MLQSITLLFLVGVFKSLQRYHCFIFILDNNERVYILDPQKRKWIAKGRYRDALEFQDSVFKLWDQTISGPTLTLFLVNFIYIYCRFVLLNI